MRTTASWLYALAYCICAMIIGGIVGAVAGVGIAGLLMRPEEATVLVAGVTFGGPIGAIVGLILGVFAATRRNPPYHE